MDGVDVICYASWGRCLSSPPLDEHVRHAADEKNYLKFTIYKKEMFCRIFSVLCLVSCRYFQTNVLFCIILNGAVIKNVLHVVVFFTFKYKYLKINQSDYMKSYNWYKPYIIIIYIFLLYQYNILKMQIIPYLFG